MDKEELKKGTRIYYNGDMANQEGLGVIISQKTDDWGTTVNIKMDDGRDINFLPVGMFSNEYLGHGGTRFVTEEAYKRFNNSVMARRGKELGRQKESV